MKPEPLEIDVTILDRTLRIACGPGEQDDLLQAVDYLNDKMRSMRDSGKVIGGERIAILTALNLAHELLARKGDPAFDIRSCERRMQRMAAAIDEALSAQEDLF